MDEILISILTTLLSFTPFALIYWFFNIAEKQSDPQQKKRIKLILLTLVALGFTSLMFLGFLFQLFALLFSVNPTIESLFLKDLQQELQIQNFSKQFSLLGFSLWIPSLVALILLIPAVRRGIARFIPIQSSNSIHTVTLLLSTLIFVQLGSTLAVGLESLSLMISDESSESIIAQLWAQDLMLFLIACLGVGYLTRRNWSETLQRLGLGKITSTQFLLGIGIAIGLVIAAYFLEIVLAPIMDQDVQKLTEKLIGPLFTSIPGVITLGLAAAIGEEAIFRGALQPRFGLWLTSLLFALVHSNYGLSLSTVIVFGVGLCLGIVRNRFNTTIAMLVHATYNICLGFISYFQT